MSEYVRPDSEGVSAGSNRHADVTDCPSCQGHRLTLVDDTDGFETYARCDQCNAAPAAVREPVNVDAWWKQ